MKQSQLFTKTKKSISGQEPSINAQLLERAGFVSKLMAGVYSYLPLGLRVLSKIENIVREEMNGLGAQEILMPALQPKENWEITSRWDKVDVLYKLKGAGDRDLCLGPTHEEIVTPLVGQYVQSYKDLPQNVYQIQTKFRNEARPKSGLLRGREFRMKDLYSFYANESDLDVYYDKVKDVYLKIFARCGLESITFLTFASGGIFSEYSHEFQVVTSYGEDIIYLCNACKIAVNKEIINKHSGCINCGNENLIEHKSIEVGNIFKLSNRFTEAFNVSYTDKTGQQKTPIMGCYGLGTSRLMGAIVEVLHDDKGILWPKEIAPYQVHLISLCKDEAGIEKVNTIYQNLQRVGIEVLFDDRPDVQAGQKFADSDLIGIPVRLVISSKTLAQNSIELKERAKSEARLIEIDNLLSVIKNYI